MPARILRPCVDSERLAALSYEAETLFFRLLQVSDDYGLAHASPLIVASTCYPAGRGGRHVDPAHVAGWLDELARAGIIRVTETSSGKLVLQIMRFGQRIRGRPRHPAPPEWLDDARRWAREAATTGAPQLASSPSDAAASADCGRLQQTAADCSTAPQHVAGRRGQPRTTADNRRSLRTTADAVCQPPQSADDIRYTDTVYGITKLPDTGAVEPGAIAPADTGACAGCRRPWRLLCRPATTSVWRSWRQATARTGLCEAGRGYTARSTTPSATPRLRRGERPASRSSTRLPRASGHAGQERH